MPAKGTTVDPTPITGNRKPVTFPIIESIIKAVEAQKALEIDRSEYKLVTDPTYTILPSDPFNIWVGDIGTYTSCNITLGTIDGTVPFVPYVIKDIVGAAATKNIIVNAASGETIEGSATSTISTNYGILKVTPITDVKWGKF